MAVYKVIQDVEAEDKILGPLSLKQLIFAAIAAGSIFIAFRLVVATGAIYVAIPFLPIVIVFGILAAPLGRDQPTEMWLAAQIRFFTKPRKRLWDQSDIKQLVNITVPKKIEKQYTDGLSQTEVRSRLKALATTLDSRGWVVKNVDVNMYPTLAYGQVESDRLIDPSSLPTAVSDFDIRPSDDIMDVTSNETAQHFNELMQASGKAHRQEVIARMHQVAQQKEEQAKTTSQQDLWFMHQPSSSQIQPGQAMFGQSIVQPHSDNDDNSDDTGFLKQAEPELSDEEKKVIEHAKQQKKQEQVQYSSHHKVVLTQAQQEALEKQQKEEAKKLQEEQARQAAEEAAKEQHKTHLSKADTIELANANLKVSTIAGLAKHKTEEKGDPGEVVVKLR